jgi:hypothetical protein
VKLPGEEKTSAGFGTHLPVYLEAGGVRSFARGGQVIVVLGKVTSTLEVRRFKGSGSVWF